MGWAKGLEEGFAVISWDIGVIVGCEDVAGIDAGLEEGFAVIGWAVGLEEGIAVVGLELHIYARIK